MSVFKAIGVTLKSHSSCTQRYYYNLARSHVCAAYAHSGSANDTASADFGYESTGICNCRNASVVGEGGHEMAVTGI